MLEKIASDLAALRKIWDKVRQDPGDTIEGRFCMKTLAQDVDQHMKDLKRLVRSVHQIDR